MSYSFSRPACFEAYYPKLHPLYSNVLDAITEENPLLQRNFENSSFAGAHLNCGPNTCTLRHRDFLNFAAGACPVFALGKFDPTRGGHLVLWDLKLVIQFPPGSLIILPSALLEHSNLPIQQGETRMSFAQYTAAGLLRWVHNGRMSDKDYRKVASPEELAEWLDHRAHLWEESIALMNVFPKTTPIINEL